MDTGRTEPFNENVAQVKRLISRDRKEFLGNSDDILDKYTTEFGDGNSGEASASGLVEGGDRSSTASMECRHAAAWRHAFAPPDF